MGVYQVAIKPSSFESIIKEWYFVTNPTFALMFHIFISRSFPLTIDEIEEILCINGVTVERQRIVFVLEDLVKRGILKSETVEVC